MSFYFHDFINLAFYDYKYIVYIFVLRYNTRFIQITLFLFIMQADNFDN